MGLVFMICKDERNIFIYNIYVWNIVCFNVIVVEIVKNNKKIKIVLCKIVYMNVV